MIFLVNHGLPLNTIPAQTAEFIPHCIPHCPRTASWQQAPLTWHTIKFPSSITQFVHSRYVESIHIVHYQYTSYTLCTCVHGYVCTYTGANTNTMSHVYMHTHTVQYTHACTQHTHTHTHTHAHNTHTPPPMLPTLLPSCTQAQRTDLSVIEEVESPLVHSQDTVPLVPFCGIKWICTEECTDIRVVIGTYICANLYARIQWEYITIKVCIRESRGQSAFYGILSMPSTSIALYR